MSPHDVIIIGGGHNGLVAATYLAKAGLKPLVLEGRPVVGGAAVNDELAPGFKCPTLAHSAGPLSPVVIKELGLERYGLDLIHPDVAVLSLSPEGRGLLLYNDPARSAEEIAGFSKTDAAKYLEFDGVLKNLAAVLVRLFNEPPPSIDHPSVRDLWNLAKAGKKLRDFGDKDLFRLLRWVPMPVADLVSEWFEHELVRATVAARGLFGTFLGPWSAGSSAVLLARATLDPHPAGQPWFVKGSMGALSQALANAAIAAGAPIQTGAEVAKIQLKNGVARGVVLASGAEIDAKAVVSNAGPQRTFLKLIDPLELDPSFLLRMHNYRTMGTVAKVNLALSGLPSFVALDHGETTKSLAGRILIAPDLEYMERAFDAAKYGRFSEAPILEIAIPSVADPSLAPAGRHVMSIYVQFAPYKLRSAEDGRAAPDWQAQRESLGDAVIKTLAVYAPELPSLILHRHVITPLDLEQTYGLTGGHIFHGELALDQMYTMRPLLGWARYRTPIEGLYLCGSGTHPGSGLTGLSGRNAAREIVKDWKKR